MMFINLVYPIT